MDFESYRQICLSLPGVTEELPFDPNTLVFKVGGKMFSAAGIEDFYRFNVKCDPEYAIELREQYPAVQPGYHMNKKHWNTILLDGSISPQLLKQWIEDSYQLVYSKLPKAIRQEIESLS